jgi:hypothetical protein
MIIRTTSQSLLIQKQQGQSERPRAQTMSQRSLLLQQQGQKDRSDFAHGDDVAKLGESAPAIALTNDVAAL